MDLSANDLIAQIYGPCESKVREIFSSLSEKNPELLFSYIDVAPQSLFEDRQKTLIVTDQFVDIDRYAWKKILKLPESLYGIYYIPEPLTHRSISKDFNLFMNRADTHRQFWFYKIIENNWLDRCAISYIGSTTRSIRSDLTAQEFVEYLHQKFFTPHYEQAYQFVRHHVPYQNFLDPGDLRKIMIQTKMSIVIETYHERTDAVTFSEKIFRALQVPRPWVLSGATGSVSKLRSMGFDVFDDYIDHDYDAYPTDQSIAQRESDMIDQVKHIMDLTVTESILDDWYRRYQTNMEILASWNQRWKNDLLQFLLDNFPEDDITCDL